MDKIIAQQKRKQEIEEMNSYANMLQALYDAFERHISELSSGNKDSELNIPPICRMSMNFAGFNNVYDFIDSLKWALSDYTYNMMTNGSIAYSEDKVFRTYKGEDVTAFDWWSEMSKFVNEISEWQGNLFHRVLQAKIQ